MLAEIPIKRGILRIINFFKQASGLQLDISTLNSLWVIPSATVAGAFVFHKFLVTRKNSKSARRIELLEGLTAEATKEHQANNLPVTNTNTQGIFEHKSATEILLIEEKYSEAYGKILGIKEIEILLRAPQPSKAFHEYVISTRFLGVRENKIVRKEESVSLLGRRISLSVFIHSFMGFLFLLISIISSSFTAWFFEKIQGMSDFTDMVPFVFLFLLSVFSAVIFLGFGVYFIVVGQSRPNDRLLTEAFGNLYDDGNQRTADSAPDSDQRS